MRDQPRFLARFWAMNRALVASGLPAIPGEWWPREIERFYLSGRRRWVVRKGRRVFASTAIAPRLAVAEMLFGEHPHVPGTPPVEYVFLSVRRDEAAGRVLGVQSVLDRLGVGYRPAGQGVHGLTLRDHPAMFRVVTANHRAAVGGTVGFAWCDEVSRWNDDRTGKNPADEVIRALAPALLTLPDARMFLVSSPLSTRDFHARAFDEGDTVRQLVSRGATWEINPTMTEEDTRREEPNVRAWSREYAAIPLDGIEDDWFGSAVDVAFVDDAGPGIRYGMRPVFAIDPAFSHDHFGWSVLTAEPGEVDEETGRARRTVWLHRSGAWKPSEVGGPKELLERLKDRVLAPAMLAAGKDGAPTVFSDQHEFHSFREVARTLGVNLIQRAWKGGTGEESKITAFRRVRSAMRDGSFRVARREDGSLKTQFRAVCGVITDAGNERIEFDTKLITEGHLDELHAVILGGVIALEGPQVAERPEPVLLTEEQRWRQERIREIEERRKRQQKRSPMGEMRRALGR